MPAWHWGTKTTRNYLRAFDTNPSSADTKMTTATSLLSPKLTKPNPFPDVWLRRQYAGGLALNQDGQVAPEVVLCLEARVASEGVLDREARMCRMFD